MSATTHVNFYENLHEAQFRLMGTVVLYDSEPYYVFAICDHKKDGIFRVYMDPVGAANHAVPDYGQFASEQPELGTYLDNWLDGNKNTPIIRKQMNSPLFNRFKPYPLGMCNYARPGSGWAGTVYLERQPQRRHEQGLTKASVYSYIISSSVLKRDAPKGGMDVDITSPSMRSCILSEHPSAQECLKNLLDPKIENEAVAFHRQFALVRGPLDMIFLAYKTDLVGVLPKNDFDFVRLSRKFVHCREVVGELGLFGSVTS